MASVETPPQSSPSQVPLHEPQAPSLQPETPLERVLAELSLLMRAGYPFLYLTTYEDGRVVSASDVLGIHLNRKVFLWNSISGLSPLGGTTRRRKEPQPLIEGLADMLRFDGPSIFVVLDAHRHLDSPELIRTLRDTSETLSERQKTILFVGTNEEIPKDLQKEIISLHFPLPDCQELIRTVKAIGEDLDDEKAELLARSGLGLTLREATRAFQKAKVEDGTLDLDDVERVLAEKQRAIKKDGALTIYSTKNSLGEVGGLTELKGWLRTRSRAFSDEARQFGLRAPRGVLLLGVQGCGKSLCSKAIAAEWKMPLLRLDMGAVFGSYIGSSEQNIRQALATAEAIAPCVLWIDEIEKGLSGLGSSDVSDAGTSSRVFSSILTWLQEREAPVFVAATANRLSGLPPELLRRGRFDEIFFVDLPSAAERKEIFNIHLRKHGRDPARFQIDALVSASEGFTGAEIEQIVIDALYEAFAARRDLADEDLAKVTATTVPLSATMAEEIENLQRWARDRARPASESQ